ncbi:MAG: transcription initiation factor IIB family protein [Euryarchaeota archaeon]|jgi:transcription initiation factor TFIIB|nr:transcription initiation factor IIB family protein [Euryarchaeota archaeon]
MKDKIEADSEQKKVNEIKKRAYANRNEIGSARRPSQVRKMVGHEGPCEECGAIEWDLDDVRGEVSCQACGLVVETDVIDPGAEWVNHKEGPDRSRVGAPSTLTLSDKGLNTTISRGDLLGSKARIHGIKGKALRDWRRRAVIDDRSKTRSSRARNLVKAMQFIRDKSGLGKQHREEAARFYRKAAEMGLVTGRSIQGVAAACVYLAAREAGIPRPVEDIARAFDMEEEMKMKELKRTIRLVARHLGAHRITGPEEYLDKFHSDLGLPPQVLGTANDLWDRIKGSLEWQGKKPSGIAGVLLYKSAQMRGSPRTQADVCKVVGVSEVTLRGLLRLLEKMMKHIGEAEFN